MKYTAKEFKEHILDEYDCWVESPTDKYTSKDYLELQKRVSYTGFKVFAHVSVFDDHPYNQHREGWAVGFDSPYTGAIYYYSGHLVTCYKDFLEEFERTDLWAI